MVSYPSIEDIYIYLNQWSDYRIGFLIVGSCSRVCYYLVAGKKPAVMHDAGTKCGALFVVEVGAGMSRQVEVRLVAYDQRSDVTDTLSCIALRKQQADQFYDSFPVSFWHLKYSLTKDVGKTPQIFSLESTQ